MYFEDNQSKAIYDNLCKLRDTGDLSYLIKAHEACGITSDSAYSFHVNLKKGQAKGKKLVLYGLGTMVHNFVTLEEKRKNTVGYLYFPFLGDIEWYGVYDKDETKQGKKEWKRLTQDELLALKNEVLICVSTKNYYEEIKSELQQAGVPEDNIVQYIFPNTQCYEEKQYYDDFMEPRNESIVIDGGCYRCDTIKRFIDWNNGLGYEKIISFEPDPINYNICRDIVEQKDLKNVELIHAGLSDSNAESSIVSNGDDTSYICQDGNQKIKLMTIDDAVKDEHCSFIKLDVEGFELESLKGAKETIQNNHPRMAISLYHKVQDLKEIPQYILELSNDYKFYLRIYSNAYLEIVLYAV